MPLNRPNNAIKICKPVDWSGRHADSCGIAAAKLRPRMSASEEEAQRRPAESEVPGTEINILITKRNHGKAQISLNLSII
jgi:hypothetical protein